MLFLCAYVARPRGDVMLITSVPHASCQRAFRFRIFTAVRIEQDTLIDIKKTASIFEQEGELDMVSQLITFGLDLKAYMKPASPWIQ